MIKASSDAALHEAFAAAEPEHFAWQTSAPFVADRERDLVRAVAKGGAAAFAEQVSAHMTPQPETCTEAETVESVMEAMTRGRFRHVPVLDEQMRLCGMISIGDVVKIRIAETVSEAAALRDYITATV